MKICVLIDKRERRQVEVPLDYVGFVVEKGFLVGYGLDCGEQHAHPAGDLCVGEGLRSRGRWGGRPPADGKAFRRKGGRDARPTTKPVAKSKPQKGGRDARPTSPE